MQRQWHLGRSRHANHAAGIAESLCIVSLDISSSLRRSLGAVTLELTSSVRAWACSSSVRRLASEPVLSASSRSAPNMPSRTGMFPPALLRI